MKVTPRDFSGDFQLGSLSSRAARSLSCGPHPAPEASNLTMILLVPGYGVGALVQAWNTTCACVNIYIYVHVCVSIYIYVHVCVYVCAYVCKYVCFKKGTLFKSHESKTKQYLTRILQMEESHGGLWGWQICIPASLPALDPALECLGIAPGPFFFKKQHIRFPGSDGFR